MFRKFLGYVSKTKENYLDINMAEKIKLKSRKTVLVLVSALATLSFSSLVLASLLTPTSTTPTQVYEPVVKGKFKMILEVKNVNDLYAWQTVIKFNPNEIKVLEIIPGGFVGMEFPSFVNATDYEKGILILGGSLLGEVPGKNGTGILATILFGYYTSEYKLPEIVDEAIGFKSVLLDSGLNEIVGYLVLKLSD